MNRWLKYFILAVLVILPQVARADKDIISYMTSILESKQRLDGSMLKGAISATQQDMQNLVDSKFAEISPDNIKKKGEDLYKKSNLVASVSDKIPADIGGQINGLASSAVLEDVTKKEFTLTKRSGDDVEKNRQLKEKENELMIENVSLLYARGLVRRYILEQEKDEEIEDYNNINEVQAVFSNTIHRANNRWISILQTEASTMAQNAMKSLTVIRTDETEEQSSGN